MKIVQIIILGLAAVIVFAGTPLGLGADEKVGKSQADLPSYVGMLVIHNPTRAAIHYQIRWGKGEWKRFTLQPDKGEKHWHPLDGNDQAPPPFVRFDNTGGDGKVTLTEYHLQFAKVGYGGFGGSRDPGRPIDYEFKYAPDGRHLDLKKR